MSKKKESIEGTTRKEFIKQATQGVFGTAMGAVMWSNIVGGHTKNKTQKIFKNLAFGSCADQKKTQPFWDGVIRNNPDLFLFLGDNIYGDTNDMEVLKKKYRKLAAKPGYQRLLKRCPVLSTWDDHDYGKNDAGSEYKMKKESEQIFMDFFDIPQDSPRRNRRGIYGSYIFGPKGKRVQIILLDTRYFKDTSGRKKNTMSAEQKNKENLVGWYLPSDDASSTILGEEQWRWLKTQFNKETELRIICSSVQFLAYEKGMESWGNYPHERQRMINLIKKTNANGTFFISGDVHFSELSRSEEGPYTLYDFTCSGMTHYEKSWSEAVNSFRVGEAYAGHNTGLIEFDWDKRDPVIHFKTVAEDGSTVLHHRVKKSELEV